MTKNDIKESLEQAKGRTAHLALANGDRVKIIHTDYVAFSPKGIELIVYLASGAYRLINLALVVSVDIGPAMPPKQEIRYKK